MSVCEILVRAAAAVDADDHLCAAFVSVFKMHAASLTSFFFSQATPLHSAALNGHDDVCRFLVQAAADPLAITRCAPPPASSSRAATNQSNTPRCSDGRTPLQWAAYNHKFETVAYLQSLNTTQSA